MIKTYGLTHISLAVADPEQSLLFYQKMFGVTEYYRDQDSIQVKGPGSKDIMAFVKSTQAGKVGGINHFGFRLTQPEDITAVLDAAKALAVNIVKTGYFADNCPYVYLKDPDGYDIEIWYE